MWQAEMRIDTATIRDNVAGLRAGTPAALMAVVKADGYGHGAVPSARAALAGGATWLGVCTLGEAAELRAAGIDAPVLAWLTGTGDDYAAAVRTDVDLSAAAVGGLDEIAAAAARVGRAARVHLKVDTGLARGGATPADWPALVEAAAKHAAAGAVEVIGVWSHFVYADVPEHPTTDRQLGVFREALAVAERIGVTPQLRHIANSAATLARPDAHFDLVRPGLACYGLSPIAGRRYGLRPAMTVRARVVLTKRVPAGTAVAYGHTYTTDRETTLALLPLGYADGVPRAASNAGAVLLGGEVRPVAGRVSMDQIVVDCGDAPVAPGDVATLFGPDRPTVDDWAAAAGTINYEIVTRFGSARVPRVYEGLDG
ncbi:alanine racemase [Pilimelia terevasa]|uniref:Alanine racemase n=1 Tax=Pilimelia terevasa TaxID=53372 RepID=A0A8J3FDS8_9ACTN|nr:alanine racemase [Pilimelia terevasa]GGK14036.1 alanine racemase [Pilimelia terevasa]